MANGKVLWFNELKGYGFVEDESGEKYLIRSEAIKENGRKNLKPGKSVKFSVEKETIEMPAQEVRLVKSLEFL
ncbi:MAG: cold-shock protein [Bdellovibrio sp.]